MVVECEGVGAAGVKEGLRKMTLRTITIYFYRLVEWGAVLASDAGPTVMRVRSIWLEGDLREEGGLLRMIMSSVLMIISGMTSIKVEESAEEFMMTS